jgi:hypothetical protein
MGKIGKNFAVTDNGISLGWMARLLAGNASLAEAERRGPNGCGSETGYDFVFQRVERGVREEHGRLSRERRAAGLLWSSLEVHPQTRRVFLIRNDRRFQTWGLYQCLLGRSRELSEDDPAAALEAAELALTITERLDPSRYGSARVADFRAAAFGALAEAKRRAGDLERARAALDQADECLEQGTGDPLEEAGIEALWSRLWCDLGEEEPARRSRTRASALTLRAGGATPAKPQDREPRYQPSAPAGRSS